MLRKVLKLVICILIFFILHLFITCRAKPEIVPVDGDVYKIMDWSGGKFYYITYHWKGGDFEAAEKIVNDFMEFIAHKEINAIAIGRFPTGRIWQLGIVVMDAVEDQIAVIEKETGYNLVTMDIRKGKYASLILKGNPENAFFYWKKFSQWLEKDNYLVKSPVFEIYRTPFDGTIIPEEQMGEIRYRVKENSGKK